MPKTPTIIPCPARSFAAFLDEEQGGFAPAERITVNIENPEWTKFVNLRAVELCLNAHKLAVLPCGQHYQAAIDEARQAVL